MPDLSHLALFCAASVALILTPGPDNIYVLTRGIAQGRVAALAAAIGFALGNLVHTLFAILGLSALLASSATLFGLVKLIGGGYLVWLGIKMLRSAGTIRTEGEMPPVRPWLIFRQSIVANILNPKVAVFFIAFFPQFIDQQAGSVPLQMIMLGCIFVVLVAILFGLVGWFAGSLGAWLQQRPRTGRRLDLGAGTVLIGLGLKLAWPSR